MKNWMKKLLYIGGGVIVGAIAYKNKEAIVNGVKNTVSKIGGGNRTAEVTEAAPATEQQPQVQNNGNRPYYRK